MLAQRTTHNAQRTTHNAQRTTHNAQRTTHVDYVNSQRLFVKVFLHSSPSFLDSGLFFVSTRKVVA